MSETEKGLVDRKGSRGLGDMLCIACLRLLNQQFYFQPTILCSFVGTGHILPLPKVTNLQRHPEEGVEPRDP